MSIVTGKPQWESLMGPSSTPKVMSSAKRKFLDEKISTPTTPNIINKNSEDRKAPWSSFKRFRICFNTFT